ncbi:MAG: GDSL-type esterase/lipase family protein [Chloroflexota bacterium]|nr:GDSL-type esterase/lipase family protein [Chloroflexota bacterium]
MIGYWLVIAMVLCALIAVVVAFAIEAPEHEIVRHSTPPRSTAPQKQVWLALGASGTTANELQDETPAPWASLLIGHLPPQAVGHNLSTPHATVAEVRRDQLPAAITSSPHAAALWVGLDDLLQGTSIEAFEEDLLAVLARLSATGCAVVLGTVPDVVGQPELQALGFTDELLRLHVQHWNASITRVGSALGATVIDGFAGSDDIEVRVRYLDDPEVFLSARGHTHLAELLYPLMLQTLPASR